MRALLLAVVALCGCYSPAVLHGPRTLEPGAYELQMGVVAGRQPRDQGAVPEGSICPAVWRLVDDCRREGWDGGPADFRLGLRVGALDRLEAGVEFSSFAMQLDALLQIVRSPAFDLAIDPTLFAGLVPGGEYLVDDPAAVVVAMRAPLIAGLNVTEQNTLVLYGGPSWIPTRHDDRVRAEAGIGWELRGINRVRLVPTFGVTTPYDTASSVGFFGALGLAVGLEGTRDYAGTGW